MYIKEILIEEFGAALNKSVKLTSGFNLLTGANESGKSTLCAFIKYVFYGFTDSKEKERHSSLKTGNSAGALIIDCDGDTYRIERRDSGRLHTVSVFSEDNGSEFTTWKNEAETPGEYFLGVPAALYTRSLYVSQTGGSRLDGGSAEAVSNLLLSGDEALNLKQAKKLLDSVRKELKLKKGQGGRIYESEQRLRQLKDRRARGLAVKKEIEGLILDLQNEERSIKEISAQLNEAKASLERIKSHKIKVYLNSLKDAETRLSKNAVMTEAVTKEYTHSGFFPDKAYIDALISAEKELKIYEEQKKNLERQIKKLRAELSLTPPKSYEAYCKLGKKDSIISYFNRYQSSLTSYNIAFLTSMFLAFISMCAVIGMHLNFFTGPSTFMFIVLGISLAAAIATAAARTYPQNKLRKLMSSLGVEKTHTPHEICNECDEYEKKLGGNSRYLIDTLEETEKNIQSLASKEKTLLSKWNKSSAQSAIDAFNAVNEKLDELKKEKQTALGEKNVLSAYLSQYSQSEIAAAEALGDEEPPSKALINSINDEYIRSLEEHLGAAARRRNEINLSLAASGANKLDIERITFDIENEETQLKEYTEKHSAIMLALDALDSAEKNIRQTVSPYLSKHSSEYFAKITEGRYPQLRLDSEMNLSYLGAGAEAVTDSMYLSGGSSDLAWLCLRLALHKRLSDNKKVPLVLDECLVYFDDARLLMILNELTDISKRGIQVLLLSASTRESAHKGIENHITLNIT